MTVWMQQVPLRAQLHEPSGDTGPDNNAPANCVPACLSSGFSWFTGRAYYGDEVKDAVYGDAYVGATDPARFIDYAASLGVHLSVVQASGTAATDIIIGEIKRGMLCTGAIPSEWGIQDAAYIAANGGGTHEVLWCGYDDAAGTLTAMNPEMAGQAGWHVMPVSWWASRIVYNRVLPMEGKPVAISDGNMGTGFKAYADSHGVTAPNLVGGEIPGVIDGSYTAWQDSLVLFYRSDVGVRDDMAGHVVGQLTAKVRALISQVASLQQQLAAAQANQGGDPLAAEALAVARAQKALEGKL